MCSKRRVKIKLDVRNYVKIMEQLGVIDRGDGSDVREFTVDIEDSKENYEYLAKEGDVLDWDVIPTITTITTQPGTIGITDDWWKNPQPGWGQVWCNNDPSKIVLGKAEANTVSCCQTDPGADLSVTNVNLNNESVFLTSSPKASTNVEKYLSWEEEKELILSRLGEYYENKPMDSEIAYKIICAFLALKKKSPAIRLTHKVIDREIIPILGSVQSGVESSVDTAMIAFLGGYFANSGYSEVLELIHSGWNKIQGNFGIVKTIETICDVNF